MFYTYFVITKARHTYYRDRKDLRTYRKDFLVTYNYFLSEVTYSRIPFFDKNFYIWRLLIQLLQITVNLQPFWKHMSTEPSVYCQYIKSTLGASPFQLKLLGPSLQENSCQYSKLSCSSVFISQWCGKIPPLHVFFLHSCPEWLSTAGESPPSGQTNITMNS